MNQSMTVSFPGGTRVTAQYDGFAIATDQDRDSGGEASAPQPYDLFLASLATCAGYYVLKFCRTRELPTEGIEVVQSWERDGDGKRIHRIRIEIRVPESFPAKYRSALVRAADQCAVKKTMQDPPDIVTETAVI